MQEGLRHAEGIILVIVRSHAYLADKLLFGGGKLGRSHPGITQAFQFFIHKAGTERRVLRIAAEINAESSGIGVGSQVGLYIIDQTAPFAQGHIQPAVHARTAENVVQQVERRTLVFVGIVSPAAYHDVRLVGIFMQNQIFRNIQRRRRTTGIDSHSRNVSQQFLRPAHHLPEIHITQHKEHHIAGMIKAGSKGGRIFAAEFLQLLRITENIASQRVSAKD